LADKAESMLRTCPCRSCCASAALATR
jgi:hypothetical protein